MLCLALSACAVTPSAPCRTPANAEVQAELLFGLSMPGGRSVSAAQFDAFVAAELTPRFFAGLTILPGAGQWRAPDGSLQAEGARMVLIVAPDTPDTAARLDAARQAYRLAFHQKSVGLITVQSCAAF